MISAAEALDSILRNTRPLRGESVSLAEAVGRVAAETIFAQDDLPPFSSSAMDGFAVRAVDCAFTDNWPPPSLKIQETSRAGRASAVTLWPGKAIKIMTGAPIPNGADAVVMKESTCESADGWVKILRPPRRGQHIRDRGEDVCRGDSILAEGTQIRPYESALLAAQGVENLRAFARPRVALLATGDELAGPSRPLSPGQIRDSNSPALAAGQVGYIRPSYHQRTA